MRLRCWEDIEGLYLSKNGNFRKNNSTYYYKESCENCKEHFLATNSSKGDFCSKKCAQSGKNSGFYGKHHTEKTKEKQSKHRLGKYHTIETKKKISNYRKGRYKRENSPLWKGEYNEKNIPLYDTYASQIDWCEGVKRNDEDKNILEVKCFKCGKWYIPKSWNVINRIQSLKNNTRGYNRFYCSDNCKNSCSIYGKSPEQLIKEDAIRVGRLQWLELNREVQPELRKMVLERDKYKCIKCHDNTNLQCHHILPVINNPIESADVDNCITLCIKCHKKTHEKDGCRLGQLKMEIC